MPCQQPHHTLSMPTNALRWMTMYCHMQCGERCPSAFNSFELPSWMLYQADQLLWDSGLVGVKVAARCRVRVQYWWGM
jgi:hypothetical protein